MMAEHPWTDWVECDYCGGSGVDGHDCGEDVCCCLNPEDNLVCQFCGGKGGIQQSEDDLNIGHRRFFFLRGGPFGDDLAAIDERDEEEC